MRDLPKRIRHAFCPQVDVEGHPGLPAEDPDIAMELELQGIVRRQCLVHQEIIVYRGKPISLEVVSTVASIITAIGVVAGLIVAIVR